MLIYTVKSTNHIFLFILAAQKYVTCTEICYLLIKSLWLLQCTVGSVCFNISKTDIQMLKDIKIFIGVHTRRKKRTNTDNPMLPHMLATLNWTVSCGKTHLIRARHAAWFLPVERFMAFWSLELFTWLSQ